MSGGHSCGATARTLGPTHHKGLTESRLEMLSRADQQPVLQEATTDNYAASQNHTPVELALNTTYWLQQQIVQA